MPSIGLIDDRPDQRETMNSRIQRALRADNYDDWKVVETDPFPSIDDYDRWLHDNEVAVLITDQRLNEKVSASTGSAVAYAGHELIARVRTYRPDLPIYVVTSYTDEVLDEERASYEFAVERNKFNREPTKFVPVMIRNGTRFLEQHAQRLTELSDLSSKAATGAATEIDLRRIGALQLAVRHAYDFEATATKADLLDDFEERVNAFEEAINDLKRQLDEAEAE